MRNTLFAWMAVGLCTAAAAQTAPALGQLPTRMQFCQQEVQGLEGDERRAALRSCLVRRAEGEKLVTSDCREQIERVPAEPAARAQLQRECVHRGLSVHSSELPRAPEPIPAPAPIEPAAAPEPGPAEQSTPDDGADAGGVDRGVVPVMLPDVPQS